MDPESVLTVSAAAREFAAKVAPVIQRSNPTFTVETIADVLEVDVVCSAQGVCDAFGVVTAGERRVARAAICDGLAAFDSRHGAA